MLKLTGLCWIATYEELEGQTQPAEKRSDLEIDISSEGSRAEAAEAGVQVAVGGGGACAGSTDV